MEGSAAVIGEMMLPVLEPRSPGGQGAGPVARAGLPADQLPARRRRGSRPGPGLPAAGGPAPVRGRPGRRGRDAGVAGLDGVRDRAQPGAVRLRRHRDRPAAAPVGPLRRRPPGCSTPRSWTGSRRATTTCSPRRARVPTWRKAATAGADHGRRATADAESADSTDEGHLRCHFERALATCRRGCRPASASADPDRPGAAAARGPDDLDLAAGQARPDRRGADGRPRRRTPAAGSSPGAAPTSGARSRWPGPSPAARWCSGATRRRDAGRRARRLPAPRGADGRLPGAGRHDVLPLARHGLRPSRATATWSPYRAYDDGVLIWVGLPTAGETPTERPTLPPRPPLTESVTAVIADPGVCEPQDVIANRLDPWHGSWFHPYAFSHLVVDDEASDEHTPGGRRDVPAQPRPGACRCGRSSPAPTPGPS